MGRMLHGALQRAWTAWVDDLRFGRLAAEIAEEAHAAAHAEEAAQEEAQEEARARFEARCEASLAAAESGFEEARAALLHSHAALEETARLATAGEAEALEGSSRLARLQEASRARSDVEAEGLRAAVERAQREQSELRQRLDAEHAQLEAVESIESQTRQAEVLARREARREAQQLKRQVKDGADMRSREARAVGEVAEQEAALRAQYRAELTGLASQNHKAAELLQGEHSERLSHLEEAHADALARVERGYLATEGAQRMAAELQEESVSTAEIGLHASLAQLSRAKASAEAAASNERAAQGTLQSMRLELRTMARDRAASSAEQTDAVHGSAHMHGLELSDFDDAACAAFERAVVECLGVEGRAIVRVRGASAGSVNVDYEIVPVDAEHSAAELLAAARARLEGPAGAEALAATLSSALGRPVRVSEIGVRLHVAPAPRVDCAKLEAAVATAKEAALSETYSGATEALEEMLAFAKAEEESAIARCDPHGTAMAPRIGEAEQPGAAASDTAVAGRSPSPDTEAAQDAKAADDTRRAEPPLQRAGLEGQAGRASQLPLTRRLAAGAAKEAAERFELAQGLLRAHLHDTSVTLSSWQQRHQLGQQKEQRVLPVLLVRFLDHWWKRRVLQRLASSAEYSRSRDQAQLLEASVAATEAAEVCLAQAEGEYEGELRRLQAAQEQEAAQRRAFEREADAEAAIHSRATAEAEATAEAKAEAKAEATAEALREEMEHHLEEVHGPMREELHDTMEEEVGAIEPIFASLPPSLPRPPPSLAPLPRFLAPLPAACLLPRPPAPLSLELTCHPRYRACTPAMPPVSFPNPRAPTHVPPPPSIASPPASSPLQLHHELEALHHQTEEQRWQEEAAFHESMAEQEAVQQVRVVQRCAALCRAVAAG